MCESYKFTACVFLLFVLFVLVCFHIFCLVMHLSPRTNRLYPVVQSFHFLFFFSFFEGGSPYPRMEGRKIANLLQQGYRMLKPEHVDNDL